MEAVAQQAAAPYTSGECGVDTEVTSAVAQQADEQRRHVDVGVSADTKIIPPDTPTVRARSDDTGQSASSQQRRQSGPITRRQAALAKEEMGAVSLPALSDTVITAGLRGPSAHSRGTIARRGTDVQRGALALTSPLLPYLVPAAEQAAVGSGSKRARDEDNSPVKLLKQVKLDKGVNSLHFDDMADAYASMNIRALRVRVDGPDPQEGTAASTFVGMPRQGPEIPHNRIMIVPGGQMPVRGSINAAGHDTFARLAMRIPRYTTMAVPLGFKVLPATGLYMRLAETSSWACSHPMYILRAGVVDPDFRGEVCAMLTYIGIDEFGYINKGDRIAMMVGTFFRADPFHGVRELPRSGRGEKAGFHKYVHSCSPPCKDLRDINASIIENENFNNKNDGRISEDEAPDDIPFPVNGPLRQDDD
jgi:dUTPase